MNNKTKVILGISVSVAIVAVLVVLFVFKDKSHNVNFDTDGGSYTMPQIIKNGDFLIKPNDPVREGYRFIRWELNGREYDFTSPVKSDIYLKAIWEKVDIEVVKHKVTFNVDGVIKELEVSDANEINLDELGFEEKNGYEIEWFLNGEKYDFTKPITQDLTIEGRYVKSEAYTVKFDSAGGDKVANQKINKGDKAKEPNAIKRRGYIFEGWYLKDKKYDFNKEVTGNITLKAKWKEDTSVKRYTVKFDTDKGNNISSQRVIENNKATKPSNPSKSGYKFVEWQLNGKSYNFNSPVTKDITLKAIWHELEKYIVTFDTDGGSSVTSQTIVEGNTVKEPVKPTKDGYTFKCWSLDGKNYTFKEKVNKNIILKAEWTVKPASVEYTVTFDTNGGSNVPKQTITSGGTAKEPSKPTKSGHTFKGWRLNGNPYDFSKPVNANIILVALWEQNQVQDKYTVSVSEVRFSTDVILRVKKNGSVITVKEIRNSNGNKIEGAYFKGSDIYIASVEVDDITSFRVVLNDGTQVTAKKE